MPRSISTCPCSRLLQLRHAALKGGIKPPSKQGRALLLLRGETAKQFRHLNNLLTFPSVANSLISTTLCTHPELLRTTWQTSTRFNFRSVSLKRSSTKQRAVKQGRDCSSGRCGLLLSTQLMMLADHGPLLVMKKAKHTCNRETLIHPTPYS